MADEQYHQHPRPEGQHDTNVLWPTAGAATQTGYGLPQGEQPPPQHQQAFVPGNPEAAYWESKYRRQRTWTAVLGATMVAGLLLFVGGGLFIWNVALPRAASTVSQQLSDVLPGLGLPDSDGLLPAPNSPNTPEGGGGQAPAPQDLSDIPLPEQLRGLGSMLGISNLEQLLDTAVSMGLMTQEQADQLRGAIASGAPVDELLGSAAPGVSSQGSPLGNH